MYEVDTNVIYGANGVCTIVDIRKEKFRGTERAYYVMKPMSDKESTIFVPLDNESSIAKIKPLLSATEVHALIQSMPGEEILWEDNDKARREQYAAILEKGDRKELIQLVKSIYSQQASREESGKRLWAIDENAMNRAEKMLYEEFAVALGIEPEQVLPYIMRELERLEEKADAEQS